MPLTLLPSDCVNLADNRVPCPACTPAIDPTADCDLCDNERTVVADTGREALSHTRLKAFLACSRKFELSYRERLERIDTSAALELGRAFARALEHNDPAHGAAYLRARAVINGQADEDRARIMGATVAAGARYYLSRYGARTGEQREVTYRVRLRSPWTGAYSRTFDLTGRADGVIDCGSHLELIEDKFVGQVTEASVKKLKMDRQISLTCYGLYRATGKLVRVIHYRQTRKPSIKQKQGRNGVGAETVDQFIERLAADYANPERHDFYGYEQSLFRSEEDLATTEAELWTWAAQIRESAQHHLFPKNTDACLEWGGCAFMPICAGDPDALTLYRRRPDRTAAPTTATEEAAA